MIPTPRPRRQRFAALPCHPLLAALPFILCAAWTLFVGNGDVWNRQMGQWPAGLKAWTGSLAIDFIILAIPAAAAAFLLRKRGMSAFLAVLLAAGQLAALRAAWPSIAGVFPHGIDHPGFMFRVREFGAIFPAALGSYNPWWNAGTEHFVGVTSGAQNFALINLPLFAFADIAGWYGPALFFWLAVGFPWLGVFSLRLAGARWEGAIAGGMLLCSATRAMFLFFWQSGNVGAMVSAMLALPVVALGWRLAVLRRGGVRTALALGISAWLACIWSPCVFVCAGVALGWLLNIRSQTRRSTALLFAAGALALLLLAPWLLATFFPCRGIIDHVGAGTARETQWQMAYAGLGQLVRRIEEWHPLVIFAGLFSAFFCFRGRQRRFLLAFIIPLMIAVLSIGWKRQSQFDRMAIPLAMACVLPAAIQIGRLLAPGRARRLPPIVRATAQGAALALLATGLRVTAAHCGNSAGFKLWPVQDGVFEFTDIIRREVPAGARLAFFGATDFRYEWGKPAYLPILAGREMMSDDYYGYPKELIQRDYPPKPYRESIEGVIAFSQAYGITHWSVAEENWRKFCNSEPGRFRRIHSQRMQGSTIDVFEILGMAAPTRFLVGAGRVEARENTIDIHPADPGGAPVVIRYNWRDGLICRTPGATIAPHPVDGNLVFIAITPNGCEKIQIGYRPLWQPLKPNFDGTFHH